MEAVIRYKSDSGVVFSTIEAAIKEDVYYAKCQKILEMLPNTKDAPSNWSNGHGYFLCDKENVDIASNKFLAAASEYFQQTFTNVNGIVGRWVSDSQSAAFNELIYKLQSIDKKYRMWGQIYYAINPSKGEPIQLN